jgi:hypothetical protein
VDLFSGLGGFRLAPEQSGHRCVFASESNSELQDIYAKNFGFTPTGDIRTKFTVAKHQASKPAPNRLKAVPTSIRIGQRGINVIERVVEEMGHLWTPTRPSSDAGTDGYIELCDHEGGATGQIVQVQSKASLGRFRNETATTFEFLCDERDLSRWLEGNAPFVLIVSRPPDEAYWVPIKTYFCTAEVRAKRVVIFDKVAHAFKKDATDALKRLAVPRSAGIYTQTPPPRDETLFSNLIPVGRYAQHVHFAETTFRKAEALIKEFAKLVEHGRGEWFLKDKYIYSFHNLRDHPWSQVCDVGTEDHFPTDDWALSTDREKTNDFVRLLGECLRDHLGRRGVKFYRRKKGVRGYFFFKPTKDLSPRVERWRALQKWGERTVFEAHNSKIDPKRIAYYRHLAFVPKFRRLGGQWFLEVTPTYHFTRDGQVPDRYREDRLSTIKRIEKNAAVFANTLFWQRFIVGTEDLFRKGNEFIHLADPLDFRVGFGVNDDEWKTQAEEEEKAEFQEEGGAELVLNL